VGEQRSQPGPVRPLGISHVAVVTADLDGFRAFYQDTIGLETEVVHGPRSGHGRQAVLVAGDATLHVFEVEGYDPAARGLRPTMFERGRLDHFGFSVRDEAELVEVRDRLVEADASGGDIRRLGPMLSVRFHDPDGFEGEINCPDPAYDPSTARGETEVVAPDRFVRTRRGPGAPRPTTPSSPTEP
jgi:catechol 2,3-dioxygenase-like lactoylglutathione lyase family enzyme